MTFSPPPSFPGAARLARQRLIRRVAVIALLLGVLVAVALLWPRPGRGPLEVATTSEAASPDGVVRGPLAAVRTGDRVCFSVPASFGRALLVMPEGWTASDDLDLLDAGGGTAAYPREEVVVTGSPRSATAQAGCPGSGRVWAVVSVAPVR